MASRSRSSPCLRRMRLGPRPELAPNEAETREVLCVKKYLTLASLPPTIAALSVRRGGRRASPKERGVDESPDRSSSCSRRTPSFHKKSTHRRRWLPERMSVAPELDPNAVPGPRRRRYALLINPFYPKDPHASFGKHVLTPTPRADERSPAPRRRAGRCATGTRTCCRGRRRSTRSRKSSASPCISRSPSARTSWRAGTAQWGAKVVLGGLHVLIAPEEARPHADALAIGEGVQLWPQILARRRGGHAAEGLSRRLPRARIATTRRRGATCCRATASSRRRA